MKPFDLQSLLTKRYKSSCVLCFSGGQDSTTLALWSLSAFEKTYLLGFDYAQRHGIELEQATKIATQLKLPFKILSLDFLQELSNSALFKKSPQSIQAPHMKNPQLPASFVPDRNALFVTLAHAYAFNLGASFVLLGISEQDYSGYFDCRQNFLESLQTSLNLGAFGTPEGITLLAPFMFMSKAQEFALAQKLGFLDFILEQTHTCYIGDRSIRHPYGYGCGTCPACLLRQKGYENFLKESNK
ncbi:7-cyano-7-deazaguanine synthase QueC [Helicobacter suis]|uniref:7-cyano-7-deazaguanine synthase n=1 Tax=Helicobacter suis TaxID=104628 RepID=A0A6J4CVR7_9HELI|nr:7-cyano-7-deazaguanine synthase QueC [Helicobacter suis]BCD69451.1 7-cyano-7-deazaguanine synthase ExsB [Helicobacter suis]